MSPDHQKDWIFLSPHFDDIALSCGGLVWELVQRGDAVAVWTICGGSPDPGLPYSEYAQLLHTRWNSGPEAVHMRQAEDIASCQAMGANWRHLPLADCIYRTGLNGQHLYTSEEALWGETSPDEEPLIQALAKTLLDEIPPMAQVISPLTLGDHVDHRLVRSAAEQSGRALWYYADYPYAIKSESLRRLAGLPESGWEPTPYAVSRAGLEAWQAAVAAHRSQISSFWSTLEAMRHGIEAYWKEQQEGVVLWQAPSTFHLALL